MIAATLKTALFFTALILICVAGLFRVMLRSQNSEPMGDWQ